jgi:RHS repeat-associated protein
LGSGWYPNGETRYIYDGRLVIQERNSSNTPTVSYTRGIDLSGTLHVSGGIGGLLARSHGYSGGSWSTHNFYHADGNGNITYLVNSSQGMAALYRYDPYGRLLYTSGSLAGANVYRFSSKEIHVNSGLYYYGFRFYYPNLQRWLSRDPINENGGVNLYGFVRNDPIRRCDAFGQADDEVGWPYPDPKPGQPPPQYPPPMHLPKPPLKIFRKYNCSCCDETTINYNLDELKRRFRLAKSYLDKKLKPTDMHPQGHTSCAACSERILQFMEPTPPCWICFLDRRWDQDPVHPPRGGPFRLPPPFSDENFIHCFTANRNGIEKEIIFDYFEYRYYDEMHGNGICENADLAGFYSRHPYHGIPERPAFPRYTNCNSPKKQCNPDYYTFSALNPSGGPSE